MLLFDSNFLCVDGLIDADDLGNKERREEQMSEMHNIIQCPRGKKKKTCVCHDVYKRIQEFIGECCPREVDSEYQSLNFLKCDLSLKRNSNSFHYQLYQVLSRHRGFSYNQIYAAVAFIKEDYAFNEISQSVSLAYLVLLSVLLHYQTGKWILGHFLPSFLNQQQI